MLMCSGGHLNPAMSLGVWLAGSMNVLRFRRFILYAFCQFVGATIGAAMALVRRNGATKQITLIWDGKLVGGGGGGS